MKFIKDIEGDWISVAMIDRIYIHAPEPSPYDPEKPKQDYTVTALMKESETMELYYDLFWSDKEPEARGFMNELVKRINATSFKN